MKLKSILPYITLGILPLCRYLAAIARAEHEKARTAAARLNLDHERQNAITFSLNLILQLNEKYGIPTLFQFLTVEELEQYGLEAMVDFTSKVNVYSRPHHPAWVNASTLAGVWCAHCKTVEELAAWTQKFSEKVIEVIFKNISQRTLAIYHEQGANCDVNMAITFWRTVQKAKFAHRWIPSFVIFKEVNRLGIAVVRMVGHTVATLQTLIDNLNDVIAHYNHGEGPIPAHTDAHYFARLAQGVIRRDDPTTTLAVLTEDLLLITNAPGRIKDDGRYNWEPTDPIAAAAQVDRMIERHSPGKTTVEKYDYLMELHWSVGYHLSSKEDREGQPGWSANSPLIRAANALMRQYPHAFAQHKKQEVRQLAAQYA